MCADPTTAAQRCDPLWGEQAAEWDGARLTPGRQAAPTGAQRRGHARSRGGLVPGSAARAAGALQALQQGSVLVAPGRPPCPRPLVAGAGTSRVRTEPCRV